MTKRARRAWNAARVAALAILAVGSSAAWADIPVSIRVGVYSEDFEQRALAKSYVQYLAALDEFQLSEEGMPLVSMNWVEPCWGKEIEPDQCVRELIKPGDLDKELPPIAVLVFKKADGAQRWICLGAGDAPYWREKQRIDVNLEKALFGTPEERASIRRRAVACIFAAGTEAGGRINLSKP